MSDFSFPSGYPSLVNRTKEVKGAVIVVKWKPCTATLFTIYHREVFSENEKSHWSGVNVSGHETHYDLNLRCLKEYEIAMTAWNSTAETPLKVLNHDKMWRVTTITGNHKGQCAICIWKRTIRIQFIRVTAHTAMRSKLSRYFPQLFSCFPQNHLVKMVFKNKSFSTVRPS